VDRLAVVADRQPYGVIPSVDLHVDPGGVACMPQGVRHGLLCDAIRGCRDHWAERVEIAREAHLHPRFVVEAAHEPLDVGNAVLRGEVGLSAVAQRPHHRPHLGEGTGALVLDELERIERRCRVRRGGSAEQAMTTCADC
jgi:hypothetical protein